MSLTPEQKTNLRTNMAHCIKETGVDLQVVDEAKKGNFADDENLKKFIHCFFKKIGVVDDDGQIHVDVALQKLPAGIDKAAAEQLLNDCKAKTGNDAVENAFEVFKCYYAGTKQHIIIE